MIAGRRGSSRFVSVLVIVAALAVGWYVFVNSVLPSLPMTDLQVYRSGGYKLIHGIPLYDGKVEGIRLPFTYPPFAAVLFVPFALIGAWGGSLAISFASFLALARACQLLVVARWPAHDRVWQWHAAAVLWAVALLAEPTRATLEFGQINLLILWLVLEDLLGSRRGQPGVLVGIATGLKLTPGLFIVLFMVVGKRTAALRALAALGATIVIGLLAQPQQGWLYWTKLAYVDTRVGGVAYVANQSLNGLIWRLIGPGGNRALWFLVALLMAGLVLWAARRLWQVDQRLSAVGVTALGMLLVSPISWSHHWVWALPAGVALTGITRRWQAYALWLLGLMTFYTRSIFRVPNTKNREYGHNFWQHIEGNSYVLWALATVAVLVYHAHRVDRGEVPVDLVSQPAR